MFGKPIFIVGTPRSGTTLTAKILGNHSNLFMPGETHYFDDVFSRAPELGDLSNRDSLNKAVERLYSLYGRYHELEDQQKIVEIFPDEADLLYALKDCQDYGVLFNRFMTLRMEAEGGCRWGNNAPRDLFSIREIKSMFPDAKFVVCVRDIRAFLLSYQGKWKVTGEEHVERLKALYHPVVTSYLWKSSIRQLQLLESLILPEDRVFVRYEELVSSPEKVIRSVCKIIEEEFEPSMLNISSHNSSDAKGDMGIFSTSIDRWKTNLTAEEIAVSQIIAKDEMRRLGYDDLNVMPNKYRLIYIWLSVPVALWRALSANKDSRGPLIPYLMKRVGSLLGVAT